MAILNDNKKDGLVVEYYPLTNIISREHYLVDGEVKGRVKEFYSNGQIERTYFIKDGNKFASEGGLSGISQQWWSNGNERSITYEDSDGINKTWYKSGNIESETEFKNKIKISENWWHETGEIDSSYKLIGNKGKYVGWDESGNITTKGSYIDGKLEGKVFGTSGFFSNLCNTFDNKFELTYKNGKREGLYTGYSYSGEKTTINYSNDEKEGIETRYHKNGQKKSEEEYSQGKVVDGSRLCWDDKGNSIKVVKEKSSNRKPSRNDDGPDLYDNALTEDEQGLGREFWSDMDL